MLDNVTQNSAELSPLRGKGLMQSSECGVVLEGPFCSSLLCRGYQKFWVYTFIKTPCLLLSTDWENRSKSVLSLPINATREGIDLLCLSDISNTQHTVGPSKVLLNEK